MQEFGEFLYSDQPAAEFIEFFGKPRDVLDQPFTDFEIICFGTSGQARGHQR